MKEPGAHQHRDVLRVRYVGPDSVFISFRPIERVWDQHVPHVQRAGENKCAAACTTTTLQITNTHPNQDLLPSNPHFIAGKGRVISARLLACCSPNVGPTVGGDRTIRAAAFDAGYHVEYT